MIDPHKYDHEFEGQEPTIQACITHLRILQNRTEQYDEMFPYKTREDCEILAGLDYFFFERIIEILKAEESRACPE